MYEYTWSIVIHDPYVVIFIYLLDKSTKELKILKTKYISSFLTVTKIRWSMFCRRSLTKKFFPLLERVCRRLHHVTGVTMWDTEVELNGKSEQEEAHTDVVKIQTLVTIFSSSFLSFCFSPKTFIRVSHGFLNESFKGKCSYMGLSNKESIGDRFIIFSFLHRKEE